MTAENLSSEPDVSEEHPISEHWVWTGHHRPPVPRQLVEAMTRDWAPDAPETQRHPAVDRTATRRAAISAKFPSHTLVIPTGNPKVRANDTDYRFRAGTDFFYLTACQEPDCVLVITPSSSGPISTLYIARRRDQQSHEFFTNAQYGELWVGKRRGVDEAATYYAIDTAPLEYLEKDLSSLAAGTVLVVRGFDHTVDTLIEAHERDGELVAELSEMRLVKDDYEIEQLEAAIAHTVKGFEDVVRALPSAVGRGERVIEGVFNLRARVEGYDVGYNTIAASGAHATILHWTTNDGIVHPDELLLLDAGVECNELYTADVTRTIPISGTFSLAQRRIYDIVLRAQQATMDIIRPGLPFKELNEKSLEVIAEGLIELGLLDEPDVATAMIPTRRLHRRYMPHGPSHMLGLDVHDCAHARNEHYFGELKEGYVLTVEPGLYFQANDLTVPEEYRGIGVRIEDDVLVTKDGYRNLSAALPRTVADIEAWMARVSARGATNLQL